MSGTSSADPDDLARYAEAGAQLSETLGRRASALVEAYNAYTAQPTDFPVDASSVLEALATWHGQNLVDDAWVAVVGEAFRRAGGEGDVTSAADADIAALLAAAGVPTGPRQSVTFDDPVLNGMPPTSGYAADPVCTATGHFVEVEVDLEAPPTAALLAWTRVYGSRHVEAGPFGRGWSSWASARLEPARDGVQFTGPDGRRALFATDPDGGYERVRGIAGQLTARPDGGWALAWFAGDRWLFDAAGRPVAVEDAGGAGTTRLEWSDRRLVGMAAPSGRRLDLDWDGDRVTALRSSDGRVATYRYDDAGDLVETAAPSGDRRYTVDGGGLITVLTDADGVELVRNAYDAEGRVLTQHSPFGRRTRFAYRPDRSTVVDDDSGGPRTTYFHDGDGRLIGLVDDHGARMAKVYDTWGNPVAITDRAGALLVQEFDERGNLLRRVEPDGAVMVQEWDADDRLVRRIDPTGAVTALRYVDRDREPSVVVDPLGAETRLDVVAGQVVRVLDPDGVETRFDRDADGRVVAAIDGAGEVTRLAYDARGALVRMTGPDGAVTALERDDAGRVVARRDPTGATTGYEWSAAGRPLATVGPAGGATRREYGAHGEPVAITDGAGGTSRLEWDALGRLARLVNPNGAKLEHRHDGLGRLVAVDDPAGGSSVREYDAEGRLVALVDAAGRRREREVDVRGRTVAESDGVGTVRHAYDAAGRRVRTVDAEGGTVVVTHDAAGRPATATDAEGGVTRYEWSPAGRLWRRVSPGGRSTSWEYDAAGRATAEVGPDGGRREVDRDAAGRVVAARTPGGTETRFAFDGAGRVVQRQDPRGGVSTFAYDPAGRIAAATAADGGTTRYEWSPAGQLTAAVDPLGGTTRFAYDPAGQLLEAVDPLGGRQTHRYDEVGRLTGLTDQRGGTTSLELDPSGRLIARTDATGARLRLSLDEAGQVRAWATEGRAGEPASDGARVERDAVGRPVRFVEASGRVTALRYDRAGRPVHWAGDGAALAWTWDADGRRTSVTHTDGMVTRYGYDAAGALVTVEHPAAGRITVERDADGRPIRLRAVDHERRWTWRDGLLSRWEADGEAVDLEHDVTGRVVAELTTTGRRAYRYDAAGQLVGMVEPDGRATTWSYDRAGRRVVERSAAGMRRFRYDEGHRLVAVEGDGGTVRLSWDDGGRRTGEQRPDGSSVAYRWDALGRLERVTRRDGAGEVTVRLDVDALGHLRGVDGTRLVWDVSGAVAQVRRLGADEVVGAGAPLARFRSTGASDAAFGRVGSGGASDALSDHGGGGTAAVRPDVHGDVGGGRDPWGLPAPGGDQPRLGYRGELEVAGLTWLRNRVYDPVTAGFLSPDLLPPLLGTAAAGTPYAYAGNDPVGAVDPLGLRPLSDAEYQEMRDAANRPVWERGWDAATDWAGDAWEWTKEHADEIAAGALAVGAVVMIATGVGAPIGAGILIGMGISGGVQYATTGEIDARQLWVSGLAGGASGGVGSLFSGAGIATQAGVGAVTGMGTSAGSQAIRNGGQIDPTQLVLDGALGGVAGAAGPAIARLRGGAHPTPAATPPPPGIDPRSIRFSQTSVHGARGIADDMAVNGWRGDPIDVVQMPDGGLTTVDNTRVLAAGMTDTPVQANVHQFDEAIPDVRAGTMPSRKGDLPATWGEALEFRIGRQNAGYRNRYPSGSPFTGWEGD